MKLETAVEYGLLALTVLSAGLGVAWLALCGLAAFGRIRRRGIGR